MHILVSNHHAEIDAFHSGIGRIARELHVAENNLSALSLIGNRTGAVESLVITEHQDQAVNIDSEVFVQNIVPRLLSSTTVIVIGSLIAAPSGVLLVESIGDAARIVGREREIPSAEPARLELALATAEPAAPASRNGRHKLPALSGLVTVIEGPPEAPAEPPPARPEPRRMPDPAETVLLLDEAETELELPTAPPVAASTALPDRPETQADEPEAPEPVQRAAPPSAKAARKRPAPEASTALPDRPRASTALSEQQRAPVAVPDRTNSAESEPVAQAAPAAPAAPRRLPDPQVLTEIPETTRSLADDIRDWNERQREERGDSPANERRPASFGELLRSWLPGQRRLREQEDKLDIAMRAPRLTRCTSIAVISPKGGVGKSFLTYLVGNFLAEVRGDKVIAIDTNPDFGTLADQVRGREEQTVSSLLDEIRSIRHYSDLRRFTSKVESRLEVLAAPADPDVMATITSHEYSQVFQQLHHYYDTVMFDCGTGFRDDITRFALQTADQIVLVSAPLFITTGIVIRALGYLDQIGCDLGRVTLAINQVRQEKPLDIEYMRSRFGSRLNAICEIPFDMQLYHRMDRGEFSVEQTQPATRIAVKQLAVELVRHFE